jgi:hypothetical protein
MLGYIYGGSVIILSLTKQNTHLFIQLDETKGAVQKICLSLEIIAIEVYARHT